MFASTDEDFQKEGGGATDEMNVPESKLAYMYVSTCKLHSL